MSKSSNNLKIETLKGYCKERNFYPRPKIKKHEEEIFQEFKFRRNENRKRK